MSGRSFLDFAGVVSDFKHQGIETMVYFDVTCLFTSIPTSLMPYQPYKDEKNLHQGRRQKQPDGFPGLCRHIREADISQEQK